MMFYILGAIFRLEMVINISTVLYIFVGYIHNYSSFEAKSLQAAKIYKKRAMIAFAILILSIVLIPGRDSDSYRYYREQSLNNILIIKEINDKTEGIRLGEE